MERISLRDRPPAVFERCAKERRSGRESEHRRAPIQRGPISGALPHAGLKGARQNRRQEGAGGGRGEGKPRPHRGERPEEAGSAEAHRATAAASQAAMSGACATAIHLHLLHLMLIHDCPALRRGHFIGVDYNQFIFQARLN
jgi:hypothetical protein